MATIAGPVNVLKNLCILRILGMWHMGICTRKARRQLHSRGILYTSVCKAIQLNSSANYILQSVPINIQFVSKTNQIITFKKVAFIAGLLH